MRRFYAEWSPVEHLQYDGAANAVPVEPLFDNRCSSDVALTGRSSSATVSPGPYPSELSSTTAYKRQCSSVDAAETSRSATRRAQLAPSSQRSG
jgi:hypothetical protein